MSAGPWSSSGPATGPSWSCSPTSPAWSAPAGSPDRPTKGVPMRSTITGIQMGIRAGWLVQLALGLAFWSGNLPGLVALHRFLGILPVLALWTQAALARRAGVPAGPVAAAAVWGLVVVIVGLTQRDLLTGSAHWVIEVVHLLLGIGLVGLAENLATRAKARLAPVT